MPHMFAISSVWGKTDMKTWLNYDRTLHEPAHLFRFWFREDLGDRLNMNKLMGRQKGLNTQLSKEQTSKRETVISDMVT